MLTPEESLTIYHAGPEAVAQALCDLSQQVALLQEQIATKDKQIKVLEDQIAKNSRNSSKPPSSDGLKKPKPRSLRQKSNRKPGGQQGHPGQTLKQVERPDHVIVHPVCKCECCHRSLADEQACHVEKRQVFDIPPIQLESTEHQVQSKQCPYCGHVNKAMFPDGVNAPTQYGLRIKAVVVYLRDYQLLPSQRTCELLRDLFSCQLSEGTVANIVKTICDILDEPQEQIAQQISAASVANFDETGCSVLADRWWLHVACTANLTYYQVHPKRGSEATDHIGILPDFKGRAIHDFWKSYFKYDCDHGLCNAHHLRELIFVHEQYGQSWAKQMIDCLIDIKKSVDEARNISNHLPQDQIHTFEKRYQRILDLGYGENPLPEQPPGKKKRGRQKKSKPRNLLERLDEYRKEALAFMYDFRVPFDNNQAERDARMTKVQQKISGTFRSEGGAKAFCRIRSYISTARKNAVNAFEAIRNAFAGKPFMPPETG